MCATAFVGVSGSVVEVSFLLLPCGSQGSNPDHLARRQVPLPMSHLICPRLYFVYSSTLCSTLTTELSGAYTVREPTQPSGV